MADITYWFDELQKEVDQYQAMVERLKAIVESSNLKAIELLMKDCEAKAVRIREVKKSFGLEVRLIRDRNVRSNYEAQAAVYDERFNAASKDFSSCQVSVNKKSLLKESSTVHGFKAEGKDNDALLGEAHRLQDLTMESLGRTKNMIEASKEIGAATIEQLRGQKEQIVEIENEVDNIASNLVRAEMLVRNFTRRMATDRIIQAFFAINIVVMLSLVLYVAISGRALQAARDGGYIGPPKSVKPTRMPTISPTILPSANPSFRPSLQPSEEPTVIPSHVPSLFPTHLPSFVPTVLPSPTPSLSPSYSPTTTTSPSETPTQLPSLSPTPIPSTASPSISPTLPPTAIPSLTPSVSPTFEPSVVPTKLPTADPTLSPTDPPSPPPTLTPTVIPTLIPTQDPSPTPTVPPTPSPTPEPTPVPTPDPTSDPTPA